MNSKEYKELIQVYQNVYEQQKIGVPLKDASDSAARQQLQKMIPRGEKIHIPKSTLQNASYEPEGDLVDEQQDLFDIVQGYLLDEGYVETEEEALIMMSNMSEEAIQDIIEAAMQPSLITKTGKAQNFTKPNRVPFTSSTPQPTRSTAQATPPRRPAGGFGAKPSGQLKLDLNKPVAKPTAKPVAKPTTTTAKPVATSAKPNPYRPGATVRATGPNMDKFPQLQRFSNQARKVAEPISKVAGAAAALRKITPAGVAAAVMAPRPTGDATLKGALKRGDYKPKQGPVNPDQGLTKAQSFDKKFKAAKTSGAKQFEWSGKTYTTKMKEKFDDFDLIQDYLISEGYVDNEKEALMIMANISAEQIQEIKEDLDERRRQLAQRQREQVTSTQERVASHQQARRKKRQKAQEKEQLKNELKKEIRREAVGDPISPGSVFKLTDPINQKNLQSTMKPAGPAPIKPKVEKKSQAQSSRFVKRMVGSTMLSPL